MKLLSRALVAGGLLLSTGAACHPQQSAVQPPRPAAARSLPPAKAASCPAVAVAPDPHRPVVHLSFDLSADRRTVRGTESVRFVPDRPVTELIFRLWPNGTTAPIGTRLTVTRAVTPGGGAFTTQSLGGRGGSQGTLLAIPLGRTAAPGQLLRVDLAFVLSLPTPAFERWGSTGRTAWWASGHPLLAWERGRGWDREPAIRFPSEASTSEAADTSVTVRTPAGDDVLMTGLTAPPRRQPDGRLLWRATSSAARDVSVAVSRFVTRAATVDGVKVTVGVAPDTLPDPVLREPVDVDNLLTETLRSVRAVTAMYGAFPYPSLAVAALPSLSSGGIEYPGAIQVGNGGWHVSLPHETAHQYFYGMVGNDQARDPWLDEAFATYSEARSNGSEKAYLPNLSRPGRVGASLRSWGTDARGYYLAVYYKGAAALLTARARAGTGAFDDAIGCYIRTNAWRIATPAALAASLAELPVATAVLSQAGALP